MRKTAVLILTVVLFSSCEMNKTKVPTSSKSPISTPTIDTIPKVTGIGGVFFKAKNPKEVKYWYGTNLGIVIGPYGSPFEFRNANRPEEINYLNWDPFPDTTSYFDLSEKEFMINYRVQNIEGLVKKLKQNGVTILDEIAVYEYGKFVHIMDLEGNKIELWEPIDSFLTKMGGPTTK